jgi:hypothetical protein
MKICSTCKIEKHLIEYGKHPGCKDGVRSNCKKCKSIQDKLYRIKNSDKLKEKKDKLVIINKLKKDCYKKENENKLKEKYLGVEFGSYKIIEYLGRLKYGSSKYERHYFKKVCVFCGSESKTNTLGTLNSQIIKKPKCNSCKESINIHKKEKKCSCCSNWYPATKEFFNASKNKPFGINYYCKICSDIKSKKYRSVKENRQKEHAQKKQRRQTDPLFKLTGNIRSLIKLSIKNQGYSKKSKTHEILGCDFETFKLHLEKQFTDGMNLCNHGKWHLDHIYPVSLARDEQHLIELNHYTNFQPLWAIDNLKKGNKINTL